MNFQKDGAALFSAAVACDLAELTRLVQPHDALKAGSRITNNTQLASWLSPLGVLRPVLTELNALSHKPVRAILFDKSEHSNWALGWHQDRTICVRQRAEVSGFGPYTRKHGLNHVEPPFEIIEKMITLRLHIDDVPQNNAPLIVAPGSHSLGKIPVEQVDAVASQHEKLTCLADAGDVWAYSTPILHSSARATVAGRRRVLQVDFSNIELPYPLQWLGVG